LDNNKQPTLTYYARMSHYMVQKIKARPVPPMSADATQPADAVSSSTQSTTGAGTNSTIVDPSLDPDPATASNIQKAMSANGSTGGFGFVPTGTPVTPPQSSSSPIQQHGSSSGSASHQQLQGFYNQSHSSQYAAKTSFDTLARVSTPGEPKIEWTDNEAGGVIFTLKASSMEYNRKLFHNDTYKQAAQRFFKKIEADLRYTFKDSKEFSIRLIEYKDHPDREFVITHDAEIRHNYETDTWHWWFLDELKILVKRMDKK